MWLFLATVNWEYGRLLFGSNRKSFYPLLRFIFYSLKETVKDIPFPTQVSHVDLLQDLLLIGVKLVHPLDDPLEVE